MAAVEKFNAQAASYQADNAKAKALQIGIATAQEELNQLLADRSKLRPLVKIRFQLLSLARNRRATELLGMFPDRLLSGLAFGAEG